MVLHIRTRDEIAQLMAEVRKENCALSLAPRYQLWATRLAQQQAEPRNRSMFSLKELKTYTKREATRYRTAIAKCSALTASI